MGEGEGEDLDRRRPCRKPDLQILLLRLARGQRCLVPPDSRPLAGLAGRLIRWCPPGPPCFWRQHLGSLVAVKVPARHHSEVVSFLLYEAHA